jgi:hypothetical protein
MNHLELPRDVLTRVERRWMARFAQTPRYQPSSTSGGDPYRSPQVRRLLEGSLRPPMGVRSQEKRV